MQTLMVCPKCHSPNQDQAKFCHRCGQTLNAAVSVNAPADVQRCVQCSALLRPGAKFCGACGAQQPASAGQTPRQSPPPSYSTPPPPAPPDLIAPSIQTTQGLSRGYLLRHTILISLLAVGLCVALTGALFYQPEAVIVDQVPATPPVIPTPVPPTPIPTPTADYRQAVVALASGADGRFGLSTLQGDPGNQVDDNKLLTFSDWGETNNTRLWLDGATPQYGENGLQQPPQENQGQVQSVWGWDEIAVAQTLAYVYGTSTGRVDTIQIKYQLTNQGQVTRTVGLRLMLDTLIGDNDGVPFVVPGRDGITDHAIDLRGADVPDFVQALEFHDLANPGVIVHLTLQGAAATRPDRLVISAWCSENAEWDYYTDLGGDGHPLARCGDRNGTPDSAVGLYFDPQPLGPGASRTLITYYGLGGISSTESRNATLSLVFNRQVNQGDEFWVTALVGAPAASQNVRLELPDGLVLAAGMTAEQPVPVGGDFTQLSWRVKAEKPLVDAAVTVVLSPDGVTESQSITVIQNEGSFLNSQQ